MVHGTKRSDVDSELKGGEILKETLKLPQFTSVAWAKEMFGVNFLAKTAFKAMQLFRYHSN